ncbi:hypothetical protein MRX96_013686 [Rhipicephalus microplus]
MGSTLTFDDVMCRLTQGEELHVSPSGRGASPASSRRRGHDARASPSSPERRLPLPAGLAQPVPSGVQGIRQQQKRVEPVDVWQRREYRERAA